MEMLKHFSIPIEGMKNGIHEKTFSIGNSFFKNFEKSPIDIGSFEISLELDKRSDLIQLDFDINGNFRTICDRCLADITFPLNCIHQLLIKYAEQAREEENVMYITKDTHHVNIAKFIHDSICLSIPLTKIYDCKVSEPFPCDDTIVNKLYGLTEEEDVKDEQSIWSSLDKLDLSNN